MVLGFESDAVQFHSSKVKRGQRAGDCCHQTGNLVRPLLEEMGNNDSPERVLTGNAGVDTSHCGRHSPWRQAGASVRSSRSTVVSGNSNTAGWGEWNYENTSSSQRSMEKQAGFDNVQLSVCYTYSFVGYFLL